MSLTAGESYVTNYDLMCIVESASKRAIEKYLKQEKYVENVTEVVVNFTEEYPDTINETDRKTLCILFDDIYTSTLVKLDETEHRILKNAMGDLDFNKKTITFRCTCSLYTCCLM